MKFLLIILFCIDIVHSGSILHISDVHIDLEYHEGMPTQCWFGLFNCCHPGALPKGRYKPAGYYGSPNCTSPIHLVRDTLTNLKQYFIIHPDQKPQFTLFTGDAVNNHVTWINPWKSISYIGIFVLLFTPGNHDTWPIDQWSQYNSLITKEWYKYLQDYIPIDQKELFLKGGYYEYKINNKLKIISINSLYGERRSFILRNSDAIPMLTWLNSSLLQSRNNREKVYLIYHFGPCDSEITEYLRNRLLYIFDIYKDIIIASFSGHNHRNDHKLLPPAPSISLYTSYSSFNSNNRGYSFVNYVASSLIPTRTDPSFRLYIYNNITYEIEDSYIFSIDLKNSNKQRKLLFYELLSLKSYFNLPSLHKNDFILLFNQMKTNITTFNRYISLYYEGQQPMKCKGKCKQVFIDQLFCKR
ncbi:hypothetical protein WA158_006700 [Blastocystis sp. Blastoise]